MPSVYNQLGQINPGTSWTALYTVPAAGNVVLSTIVVCNTSTTARTFRIATVPTSGTTPTTANCQAYDTNLPANESIIMTLGMTMSGSFCVKAYGSTTDVTFTAFGTEIT